MFPSWLHERDYTAITHFSGVLCFISTDGNVPHMVVRRHKTSGSREESFMCRFWCVSFSTLCLSWDQRGGNHSFLLRLAWVRYYSVASVCSVNCFSFYLSWTELSDGSEFDILAQNDLRTEGYFQLNLKSHRGISLDIRTHEDRRHWHKPSKGPTSSQRGETVEGIILLSGIVTWCKEAGRSGNGLQVSLPGEIWQASFAADRRSVLSERNTTSDLRH